MKKVWLLGIGAAVMALAAGCRPELAPAELSPKEQKWAAFFQENYKSWEPPQTQPVSIRYDNDYTEAEKAELARRNNPEPMDVMPIEGEVVGEEIAYDGNMLMAEEFAATETAPALTPAVPAESTPAPADSVTYKVEKGDSLSKIAQKFYGNGRKYQQILDANKEVLKGNPNRLRIGQELVIPNPIKK